MTISRRRLIQQLGMFAGAAAVSSSALAGALKATARQTEGPFYPVAPLGETDVDLTMLEGHSERAVGDVILVRGRVLRVDGTPLAGAQVDIWQTNHYGRYMHPRDESPAPLDPNFQGIGITETDEQGYYGFKTIRPAAYRLSPDEDSPYRARHIHVKAAHEAADDLTTQMYFAGDPLIADDIVMRNTPAELRDALVTTPVEDPDSGLPLHVFNIVLA